MFDLITVVLRLGFAIDIISEGTWVPCCLVARPSGPKYQEHLVWVEWPFWYLNNIDASWLSE